MMCHSHRSRNRMFHLGPMTSRSPRGDRAGLILYDRRWRTRHRRTSQALASVRSDCARSNTALLDRTWSAGRRDHPRWHPRGIPALDGLEQCPDTSGEGAHGREVGADGQAGRELSAWRADDRRSRAASKLTSSPAIRKRSARAAARELARAKRARERLGTSPAHRSPARWGACTIWQLQQPCQHLDRE
jgi:hypothetical protein